MATRKQPCQYFQRDGECVYGDSCRYSHDMPEKPVGATTQPSAAQAATQGLGQLSLANEFNPTATTFQPTASEFRPGDGFENFQPSVSTPEFQPQAQPQYLEHIQPPMQQQQQQQQQQPMQQPIQQFGMAEQYYPQAQAPAEFLYPSMLPHVVEDISILAKEPSNFFVSDHLRMELLSRQQVTGISSTNIADVPSEVDNYHSLVPLEHINSQEPSKGLQLFTATYKAFSVADGQPYVLKRIASFRLTDPKSMTCVDAWKKIKHPVLINLKEVFTTKDFSDHSVVFVYDYHPHSETLLSRHLSNGPGKFIEESLLWTYIIQLTGIIRVVHAANLACRVIDPTKILVTSRSKLLLSSAAIFDVLQYEHVQSQALMSQSVVHYQQEDLLSLGRLILVLACGTMNSWARETWQQSMTHVMNHYSEDVAHILRQLLSPMMKNVNELMPRIGARFYNHMESQARYISILEGELGKELANGRLFRLSCKLNAVIDRADHQGNYTETGDKYMLKLLRSYIFHTMDPETGQPWVDLAHIVQCLNKLDTGSPDRVCLISPDEKNVMVVSYFDLKRCLNTAFQELSGAANHHVRHHLMP